jgi:hypothetical protein
LAAGVLPGVLEKEIRPMEMLLLGAVLSMFGLAVTCMAFGAATREVAALPKEAVKPAVETRFFVNAPALPVVVRTPVPIEALLLQIENHVRLEQAAAECFLESPNPTLLHSRTISQLVN